MTEHHHRAPVAPERDATETLVIALEDLFCPCCGDDLTAAIRQLPHVVRAHVDVERKVAHVTVHRGMTDAATLRAQVEGCNFWAAIYNLIAIPVAAGLLYPSLGLLLRRSSARPRCRPPPSPS